MSVYIEDDPRTPEGRAAREGKRCASGHTIKYRTTFWMCTCGCYLDSPEAREMAGMPPWEERSCE